MQNLNRMLLKRGTKLVSLDTAKQSWADFRAERGFATITPLMTPPDGNSKFAHSALFHYGVSLAAADSSGTYNTCTWSTPLCRKGCLTFAGHGPMAKVQNARILRTDWLAEDPDSFVTLLNYEIGKAEAKHGDALRVRLNVFSDLEWDRFADFLFYKAGTFYDYTKGMERAVSEIGNDFYRVVFSAHEKTTNKDILSLLDMGVSVNIVFSHVPEEYLGRPVLCIDDDDDAYRYTPGTLLGVKAKGLMRKFETFVPFIRMADKPAVQLHRLAKVS